VAGSTVAELDSGRLTTLTPRSSNGSLMFAPSKQGEGYIVVRRLPHFFILFLFLSSLAFVLAVLAVSWRRILG